MVRAFQKFKDIEKLNNIVEKHRAWLKDYEGLNYSIAEEGKHKIKWIKDKRVYSDKIFDSNINMIKELPNRLRIEFDDKLNGKKNKEIINKHIEETITILKNHKFGFIRSSHNGYSDYIWIEFKRDLKKKEKETFLAWICPKEAEIDMNFASNKRVFPVLFAPHWKYKYEREKPIEYFEGEQIDYDSLGFETQKIVKNKKVSYNGFLYETYIPKAIRFFTDKKNLAEQFIKIQPLYYDKSKLWWLWNFREYKWELIDETDILNSISEYSSVNTISSTEKNEILESLKQVSRKNKPKEIKPTWIQFKDEIIDIITGEKLKATQEYFVTNPIPWKMHNNNFESTPTMDKIFEEWVGKENVKLLYEILAYSILPDYPIHRLFCLIGSGLNGKSCFLRLLKKFVGKENVTATELDTLITSRFEITRLHKKLVCIMGETNFSEINKTSIIKKLTGQDIIGFEYKNKNPFEEQNYAKIIIATNNLPTTTDKTIGFYRRWCIIDFPNRFSEKKDILQDIPEEEYESLALKSIIILKDLLEKKEFHNEGSIEDRIKKYETKSDFLQKFIDEFTEDEPDSYIWKHDFETKFNDWCKENRHRQFSSVVLGKSMKEKGIEQGLIQADWLNDGKGGRARAWIGIKWKN